MTLAAAELDRLIHHRQEFLALHHKTYFNFGGQGSMPQRAIATIAQAHQRLQELGPFSYESYAWSVKETQKTRQAIATELQVPSQTVTLTENVLTGCNIPLWGTLWKPGDHILLSDCEYPAVVATVQELQRRFGIEYSFCPLMQTLNEGNPLSILYDYLRPQTRLVILSHILWNTGKILPMKAMVQACHDYGRQNHRLGIRVLVDAAQSVGVLPLNLTDLNADFYAFTGHKWWCGPGGVGALYINPAAYDSIRPTFIGWRGVIKDDHGDPVGFESDGRRFEVSTYDVTTLIALREAIALHNEWGTAAQRYQRIITLSHYLWRQLTQMPQVHCFRTTPPESGLVFFRLQQPTKGVHTAIVRALEEKGFQLRIIFNPNCIRACVHYFTLESEIDALVDTLTAVLSQYSM